MGAERPGKGVPGIRLGGVPNVTATDTLACPTKRRGFLQSRWRRPTVWLAAFALFVQVVIPFGQGVPLPWDTEDDLDPGFLFVCTCLDFLGQGGENPTNRPDPEQCPVAQALALAASALLPAPAAVPHTGWGTVGTPHIPADQRAIGTTPCPFRSRAPPVA